MAIVESVESGHVGTLVSLGGVIGVPNLGRRMKAYSEFTLGAGEYIVVVEANPRRLSACIQNVGDANPCRVLFNQDGGEIGYSFALYPHDSFWINQDFPWTGQVRVVSVLGTTVVATECEVQ